MVSSESGACPGGRASSAFGGRMSWNDREYFRRRAVSERAMAAAATCVRAAAIHGELAEHYAALVSDGKRPTLHLACDRAPA